MLSASATIFEPLNPFVDTLLQHNTVPKLYWHPSVQFSIWHTFSTLETDHRSPLFFRANYQDHTCTTMSRETETPGIMSCPTSSLAKCKKYTLRIIFDSRSWQCRGQRDRWCFLFQTFAVFWMLYAFFWLFPRCLNFICRCFRTLYLFHLHRQVDKDGTDRGFRNVGI